MDATPLRWSEIAEDNPIPLLTRRSFTGEKMLVARVKLAKGCHVALHQHESEQIAMVMSGHVRWFFADGRPDVEMKGGEILVLPSNVPHGLDTLEDTEVIDVLSPIGAMGVDSQRT
jgi:quercetin dioxygenase-like cupin family protein